MALLFLPLVVVGKEPARSLVKPELIGKIAPNRYLIPTNQVLTPTGRQVELPKMRPQAIALSPDGKLLVVTGKTLVLSTPLVKLRRPPARMAVRTPLLVRHSSKHQPQKHQQPTLATAKTQT